MSLGLVVDQFFWTSNYCIFISLGGKEIQHGKFGKGFQCSEGRGDIR